MDRIHDRSRFSSAAIASVARERVAPIDGTIAVDTAYTGTHGVNILYNRQINSVDRQTGLRPFARSSERFRHFDTAESTTYHATAANRRETLVARAPRECQLHAFPK